MNAKELAEALNNTQYPVRIGADLRRKAMDNGLVIIYGASDDLMELDGAIQEELGCYDGCSALFDEKGLLPNREEVLDDSELEEYFARRHNAQSIEALWCKEDGYSWTYKTGIPHETFEVIDGEEKDCRGIVFSLSDLPSSGDDLTEKALSFYKSAACYFAEGVEFMSKQQIYDALKKEFAEKNPKRIGMYSETPHIKIGNFSLSRMDPDGNNKTIWIESEEGEGGEFCENKLEEIIKVFFDTNF